MNLEKTANFLKDARTIWVAFLSMLAVLAWAGDTRWMLKGDASKITDAIQVEQLSQRNDELEIEKTYEVNQQRVKMLDALINVNKNKIDTIINKRKISGGE